MNPLDFIPEEVIQWLKARWIPAIAIIFVVPAWLGFVKIGASTVHCLAQNADFEHIDTQLTKDAFVAATQ